MDCSGERFAREAARVGAAADPVIEKMMQETGSPGAALVFIQDDCVIYSRGYGFSDVANHVAADPDRTIWPIASISKLFTATLAVQMAGDGELALDTDVNRQLVRLKIPAGGYGPITLRHLLSHTAGLDEIPGRQFDGSVPPDLAEFLSTRLVRYRPPGLRTAYSSYGIALAAVLIEDVAGRPFADLVRERIFVPAGMTNSRVMTRRGDEAGVATPYALDEGKANAAAYEWYVTTPTSSIAATASDMGRFIRMHLNDGTIEGARILPVELARAMRAQQASIHPEIPGWGLGFQLDRVNGLDLAEHGGDIGGFSSLLTLIPAKRAGFFVVSHGEGNNLRFEVKKALMDALYPAQAAAVPAPRSQDVARLNREYAGKYLSSIACQTCDGVEDVFTLSVNADGSLALWGQRWVEAGRDLFVRDDGRTYLGFSRGSNGQVDAVSAGSWRVANRLNATK